MTRALLLLAALLGVAPTARAQAFSERPYCTGITPSLPDEFAGPDASGLSLDAAFDAMLAYALDIGGIDLTMRRALFEAEPHHADRLKAVAEAYLCYSFISASALKALVLLGEPTSYFTGLIERRLDAGVGVLHDAEQALLVLPRAEALPDYRSLCARVQASPSYYLRQELCGAIQDGTTPLEAWVRLDSLHRLLPIREQLKLPAERTFVNYLRQGVYNLATGVFTPNLLSTEFDWLQGYYWMHFRRLARTHPTLAQAEAEAVFAAIARGDTLLIYPEDLLFFNPSGQTEYERYPMGATPAQFAALAGVAREALPALVPALVEVPPVDLGADLVPGPGCVEVGPGGERVARFSYTLSGASTVRVPHGPQNTLSVSDGQQPEAFYPGGSGGWGQDWPVRLPEGEAVSWTLLGQTVTVDDNSPLCGAPPAPPAPTCLGLPATIYVADGTVVGGPLDGQPYAGRLTGTDGPDVLVGTDGPDLILGLDGDDTLCGGSGDDALVGGPGTNRADGGPGTDGCDDAAEATACDGPVPLLADVRPILECVAERAGGGFTAVFGVENRSARPGRVPYGSANRITPATYDRAQPELFAMPGVVAGRPGRTPFFPGRAFTVDFASGERVVWTLRGRTSTASAGSARCPAAP